MLEIETDEERERGDRFSCLAMLLIVAVMAAFLVYAVVSGHP